MAGNSLKFAGHCDQLQVPLSRRIDHGVEGGFGWNGRAGSVRARWAAWPHRPAVSEGGGTFRSVRQRLGAFVEQFKIGSVGI